MKQRQRQVKGFTIIEVLVIVVILGVIAMIITPRILGRIGQAKTSAAASTAASLANAVRMFTIDHGMPERGSTIDIPWEKPGRAGDAAEEAATKELFRITASLLGWPEEHLSISGEYIVPLDTGERYSWLEILKRIGAPITSRGSAVDPNRSPITSFTAQVAEVSVDPDTGAVKLLRFTTAHDVGKVLNPPDHQGQIDGAVIQGVGYALSEDLQLEEGRVTTVTFGDYKVPCIQDIPRLDTVLLESDLGPGPFNARGIGENPCGSVAPAIANAVADAVGVRIKHLPITAEKVFQSLSNR